MVLESGLISEEAVQRLRERLGSFNRPRQYGVGLFNEEASRSAIRHFCQGIGDTNPLYWDISYAQATKFGTIIAPACFLYSVYWCSGRTGGLPGVHGFHAGNDWEWYRPIYLDDKISVQEQFTGLEEKESQFAGKILIQSSVTHYYNQRGEAIAKTRGWQIRAERTAARERQKYTFEPYSYSREEIEAIQEAVLGEEIRGNNPRWWEDVQVGDELKPVVKGPMSHGDITAFVAGCIGGISHGIQLPGDAPPSILGVHRSQHGRPRSHHTRPRHTGGRGERRPARRLRLRLPALLLDGPFADQLDGGRWLSQEDVRGAAPIQCGGRHHLVSWQSNRQAIGGGTAIGGHGRVGGKPAPGGHHQGDGHRTAPFQKRGRLD